MYFAEAWRGSKNPRGPVALRKPSVQASLELIMLQSQISRLWLIWFPIIGSGTLN
ncbi:hypothetical protein CJ030_MR7G010016 [Morella rubra]|uniref:Uncharacterized protein n=1 Tax=Morella rubra TaxID=262757 RepID=A0A6A1V6I6_9ROSI|nr:hypothetical protein CJ030_MR7G010016 [Morella rubra]